MFFGLNDVAFLAAAAGGATLDPDAQAYITAVEAADTQALEVGVKDAINAFVVGCKADGIWNAIKASCVLAGARTLTGALVPLVGTAPTNFNFVSGDYNRKTGLVGDGSTKYLNSNRNNNADPQDSQHIAIQVVTADTALGTATAYIGAGATNSGATQINTTSGGAIDFRSRNGTSIIAGIDTLLGVIGISRSTASNYNQRFNGATVSVTQNSQSPFNGNVLIFARNSGLNVPGLYTNARLAFYSIGESLDLALLDARVTALINAFEAAI